MLQTVTESRFSLIIINFDEHGGFADHVPPPVNVPQPDDKITFTGVSEGHNVTYDFTRLGVRYVQISTWLQDEQLADVLYIQ